MTQEKNKLYPLNPDKTLVIKSKHIFLEDGQFHAGLLFIQNGKIEKICEFNSRKVLEAFQNNQISDMHFGSTTGYGYGDIGRENAGISNAKMGEIPIRRKPKVSWVKAICPG